jgi:glutamyl-tRNA synthetase
MTSLVDRIFPDSLQTPAALEARFPPRDLKEGAMVTRVGPSPTGLMHIGTLYVGRICSHFSNQTGGVSILRIEDTDKKREVAGAVDFITHGFEHFGVNFNEGVDTNGADKGKYGPYRQSERRDIYHSFVKQLLQKGAAYPCFCTADELDSIRKEQTARRLRPGYYGAWAKWRDKSDADIVAALDAGIPYVIRFRATGSIEAKLKFEDLIFGSRDFAENDQDIVIMKSDGLPTYHFAHVVDDHLMRTTHVIRGDEWLPSVPMHLQLFAAFGWDAPKFAHIAPINKIDGSSRRKLSKRKDPEASVGYFEEQGYPKEAVLDYLMTLADASFEAWKLENNEQSTWDFPLSFKGLQGSNGPLFDFDKLGNISRNYIASLTSDMVYNRSLVWASKCKPELAVLMQSDPARVKAILSIERNSVNVRKDIEKWSDVMAEIVFFFDAHFKLNQDEARAKLSYLSQSELTSLIKDFFADYDATNDRDVWFEKVKSLATKHGFALRQKDLKTNPEIYKGTVSDVAKIFRVLLTGKETSPDLYSVMQVMGREQLNKRLSAPASWS